MNLKIKVTLLAYLCTIEEGHARLDPTAAGLNDVNHVLPNFRNSLSDCPLYYYKYGESLLAAPVGGAPVFLREFAHMAAIGWSNVDGSISWDCGGSLITESIILTAAHCTDKDTIAPDVARMGDINLYSDEDDRFAQQIKIVKIVKHENYTFSSNYFDIALLYLEKPIKLHDTVCPACLWNEHRFDFTKLEATGWGNTGFGEDKTPILLKVTVQPVTNSECNLFYDVNRKIDKGIVEEQLCAGDEIMDTCPGDSGGPLQIKLLGYTKITPFVVGVTSFGPACGFSTPAVYTRVSSYIDWIESKTNTSFDPIDCYIKYAEYRDDEPDVVIGKPSYEVSYKGLTQVIDIDSSKAHIQGAIPYSNKVLLGIGDNKTNFSTFTVGVLISDNYVLTTASSLEAKIRHPLDALVSSGSIAIKKITIHPQFDPLTHAHDIALIQLEKDVILDEERELPSCLWQYENLPELEQFDRTATGPFLRIIGHEKEENSMQSLALKFNEIKTTECSEIYKNLQNVPFLDKTIDLSKGIGSDQICAGYTKYFPVPGLCELEYGNSMQRKIVFARKFFIYDFGLNSLGHQCGFGVLATLTRISSYVDWIDSIVFGNKTGLQLIENQNDDDIKLGDKCTHNAKNDGECVAPENCPELIKEFKTNEKSFVFCTSKSPLSICCPVKLIKKDISTSLQKSSLNSCASSFLQKKPKYKETNPGIFPFMALIESKDLDKCSGALISLKYVLASANCVTELNEPNRVRLGPNNTQLTHAAEQMFGIADILFHPDFFTKKSVNSAIVKLDGNVRVTPNVIPACLWQNKTHTPWELYSSGVAENLIDLAATPKMLIYNADCKRKFYSNLTDDELCTDTFTTSTNNCNEWDDNILSAVWSENNYIVGIFSRIGKCEENPSVYQRILSSLDWMNFILSLDDE